MSWDSFLMKFLKKKEVCGSHKQYTGHTRKSTTATKRTSKKKKKQTNKCRRVIIGIQTDNQSSVSWVLDSHSPPKYNFEPWTSPSYIRFFFLFKKFIYEKQIHTYTREKEMNSNTKTHHKINSHSSPKFNFEP